jgi:hypothetical protein
MVTQTKTIKPTVIFVECKLHFISINPPTSFGFQQAIIRLCIRKWKVKTVQLQSIVTRGWGLNHFYFLFLTKLSMLQRSLHTTLLFNYITKIHYRAFYTHISSSSHVIAQTSILQYSLLYSGCTFHVTCYKSRLESSCTVSYSRECSWPAQRG